MYEYIYLAIYLCVYLQALLSPALLRVPLLLVVGVRHGMYGSTHAVMIKNGRI